MLDYKYMPDGKKVVEIAKISDAQTIVQEIFVDEDGKEFAAGDKFAAKASELFDKPVKSWASAEQQRQMNYLEYLSKEYKKEEQEGYKKIAEIKEKIQRAQSSLNSKLRYLERVAKEPLEDEIKQIIQDLYTFLSPEKKYFCKWYSGKPFIVEWSYENEKCILDKFDNGRVVGLRLVTLFGDTDGKLRWKLGNYGDYSGWWDAYMIVDSYDKAVVWAQSEFDKLKPNQISIECIKACIEIGCKIPKETIEAVYENQIASSEKTVESYKTQLANKEASHQELLEEKSKFIQEMEQLQRKEQQ